MANVTIMASVTIMARVTYDKNNYEKCNYGKRNYGKSIMANETETVRVVKLIFTDSTSCSS